VFEKLDIIYYIHNDIIKNYLINTLLEKALAKVGVKDGALPLNHSN